MEAVDCIFCKIASGKLPCRKIYEDDDVIAFMDINPISDGHTLVVSKGHFPLVHECDPVVFAKVTAKLPMVAKAVVEATEADGYNILCNNGGASGQEVPHLHFHIIPRKFGDKVLTQWPAFKYEDDKDDLIHKKILEKINI